MGENGDPEHGAQGNSPSDRTIREYASDIWKLKPVHGAVIRQAVETAASPPYRMMERDSRGCYCDGGEKFTVRHPLWKRAIHAQRRCVRVADAEAMSSAAYMCNSAKTPPACT